MQITIQIIDVSKPTVTKTSKGEYSTIEVAYKKDGKVEGKKLQSFIHPEVFKAAQGWSAGQEVSIEIGKEAGRDGKEYWQWQRVLDGASASSASTTSANGSVDVQQYIIRQSSISSAVAFLAANGGKKNTVAEALEVAQQFVDFVNGKKQEAAKSSDNDFPDDVL